MERVFQYFTLSMLTAIAVNLMGLANALMLVTCFLVVGIVFTVLEDVCGG